MTIFKHVVNENNCEMLVDNFNLFLDRLRQGYVGTQSGNNERLYIIREVKGKEKIMALTVRPYHQTDTPDFEEYDMETARYRLAGPRRFWIFKDKDMLINPVKNEIIRLREGQVFEFGLEEIKPTFLFNENLL